MKSLLDVCQTNELLLLIRCVVIIWARRNESDCFKTLCAGLSMLTLQSWKQTGVKRDQLSLLLLDQLATRTKLRAPGEKVGRAARPLLARPSNRMNSRNQIGKCINLCSRSKSLLLGDEKAFCAAAAAAGKPDSSRCGLGQPKRPFSRPKRAPVMFCSVRRSPAGRFEPPRPMLDSLYRRH